MPKSVSLNVLFTLFNKVILSKFALGVFYTVAKLPLTQYHYQPKNLPTNITTFPQIKKVY